MTTPYIKTCNCNPRIDPYHRDTNSETLTRFFVDLEDGEYGIRQDYDDNATPEPEWNGRVQSAMIHCRPDESDAKAYLESPDGIALVQRVINGASLEWNNQSNLVGSMDDDAQDAFDVLVDTLENHMGENPWSINSCADWFSAADLDISAETTNAMMHTMADTMEASATDENVILTDDVYDYLVSRRQEMRDEAAESEEN